MSSRIIPLFALLVAAGIFFAYVRPVWHGPIAETKEAIALDDQALEASNQYVEKQNALASARNEIDPENLDRLAILFLPDSVDNVGLILDLNALAARSGMSLENIDVSNSTGNADSVEQQGLPIAKNNQLGSIDLSLSASGTYKSLQSFLLGVERSARLLDVRDITVKGSETGVYNYKMTLRTYWLR